MLETDETENGVGKGLYNRNIDVPCMVQYIGLVWHDNDIAMRALNSERGLSIDRKRKKVWGIGWLTFLPHYYYYYHHRSPSKRRPWPFLVEERMKYFAAAAKWFEKFKFFAATYLPTYLPAPGELWGLYVGKIDILWASSGVFSVRWTFRLLEKKC